MNVLKILITVFVLLLSFSFHVEAEQHGSEEASDHHCVLVCHNCCHSADISAMEKNPAPVATSQSVFCFIDFSYQNPSLDTLKRPPVVSA